MSDGVGDGMGDGVSEADFLTHSVAHSLTQSLTHFLPRVGLLRDWSVRPCSASVRERGVGSRFAGTQKRAPNPKSVPVVRCGGVVG